MKGEWKVVTKSLRDHFALHTELPMNNLHVSYRSEIIRLDMNRYEDFIEKVSGWLSEY